MLDRVIGYYRELGNARQAGQTMISRGLVTGYANEPELAIVYLVRGLRLIRPGEEPAFRLSAVHALALNLVEVGDCASAKALLEKHQRLYRRGGRLNKLRWHWLKGKVAYGLGELGRAEADFHVARVSIPRQSRGL